MANGKNEKKRLEPRQVVMAAYQYLQSILTQQRISEPRIEELEPFDDKNNFWTVVLSYDALGELPFEKKQLHISKIVSSPSPTTPISNPLNSLRVSSGRPDT